MAKLSPMMERYQEAIPEYLRVTMLYPDQEDLAMEARLKIAESYERGDQWASAMAEYERAIKEHGENQEIDPSKVAYATERINWIKENKIRRR